jgi:hypothetical protein
MTRTALPTLTLLRSPRRALVITQYALLLTGSALVLVFGYGNLTVLLLFILSALLSAVTHTTLALSVQNIAQARVETLDERQRIARDRAFAAALRGLTVCLSAAWGYALLAPLLGWWLPPAERAWAALWGLAMLAYSLPTSVAAWTEADLDRERSLA